MQIKNKPCDLLITKLLQPKHIVELTDPNAAKQMAVLMNKDQKLRTLIMQSVNQYAKAYLDPLKITHFTSDN